MSHSKLAKKECVNCGRVFTPKVGSQKTCSEKCRKERAKIMQMKGRMREGRILHKRCATCGEFFETDTDWKRYCSKTCADIANKLRWRTQAEKKKEERKPKEKTVQTHCKHKDCMYRGKLGGIPYCDYLCIEKEPRGCEIDECTRYVKGKHKEAI